MYINKKMGFTLAEVLIVLVIIGVVASMTIPSLMSNIQDNEYKSAAKEAYSKISQAVKQIILDDGGVFNSYNTNYYSFKPAFVKHFKVIKDCKWNDCVPSAMESDVYKTLIGRKAMANILDDGQFVTADGMFYGIQNPQNSDMLYISVDVNGYLKGPNTFGRDLFTFQVTDKGQVLPMGANGTDYDSSTYCNRSNTSIFNGVGCMSLVLNGVEY